MYVGNVPRYLPPLFRPPSEARSLIFQVTYGCSTDSCTFCRMYKGKRFRKRAEAEVMAELEAAADVYPRTRRIFLADGDAFALSARVLEKYCRRLYELFPRLQRISAYASPQNILRRKAADLARARASGLEMLYIGVESGSAEVLRRVRKGATPDEIAESCRRVKGAGFTTSVTVVLGLGGPELLEEHATQTGRVLTACDPDYIGALTLMMHEGNQNYAETFGRPWRPLTVAETLTELRLMLAHIECDETEFRTNHASNWLALKGRLQRDRPRLLALIDEVLSDPDSDLLRPEWMRAL
jgi:radical SAM superfamily enzyme YgiQ (UPF0313 family)